MGEGLSGSFTAHQILETASKAVFSYAQKKRSSQAALMTFRYFFVRKLSR